MRCANDKNAGPVPVNLEQEINDANLRLMAVQTGILDKVGGKVQFGQRQDLFWIIMAVIAAAVLTGVSIFRKPKRR